MKKRVVFIRLLSFAILFVLLFYLTTEVLKDKRVVLEYDVTSKVKGFYAEPDKSLDFVFIGSSQLYADIAPNVLFSEYGMTSYDFCANEQPLWISYYYIKEALKHQKPKAIVMDVFTVYGDDYEKNGVTHINLDDLPWNLNKINAIKNAVRPKDRMEFYFELVRYHDTWESLDAHKIRNTFYHKNNPYKGYSPFVVAHTYEDTAKEEVVHQTLKTPIPDRAKLWLDKIVALTKEEGVDLIFIKTPNGNAKRQMLYNSVDEYAKEKNIPFLNMNVIFDGEAHINVLQAEKVTRYLGSYLKDLYDITDKRKDPAFASWIEDSQYFYHKKDKCQLLSINEPNEYFTYLKDVDATKMIAVKWDQSHPLSEKAIQYLKILGLDEKQFLTLQYPEGKPFVYLVMMDGENNVILELKGSDLAMTETNECISNGSKDKSIYNIFQLAYDLNAEKKQTCLFMDGDNYSLDQMGINVFVYDSFLQEIIEFFYLDAENQFALTRE